MHELDSWLDVQNKEVVHRVNLSNRTVRMTCTISGSDEKDLIALSERLLMPKTRLANKLLSLAIQDAAQHLAVGWRGRGKPDHLTDEEVEELVADQREDFERAVRKLHVTLAAEEVVDAALSGEGEQA